ncbi:MAG TPA: ABC transporter permease [Candidatus Eremiobacteraceae bacterium]|nr:ABC transporter permease [Candidatus Eremiobacteraceae bacterium]
MKIWEFFSAALGTLWANRARSVLTMLGIIIGTSAVISIFALGQSAAASIGETLGAFGNQGIFLLPDQSTRRFNPVRISWTDFLQVRDECTRCAKVFPVYDSYYSIREGHKKDIYELTSDNDYVLDHLTMAQGRRFDSDDIDSAAPVCDIYWPAYQKLFGSGNALGETVRIAGRRFTVVGVFADYSAGVFNSFAGAGDSLNIPYTTYHRLPGTQIEGLQIYSAPGFTSAQTIDDAEAVLKRIHGPNAAMQSFDSTQQGDAFLKVIDYVAVGISSIGAIALVVGGIGVMNIMLVSVMERTREIGIRKAIGASRTDILVQFLTESVAITLIGGFVGTLFGMFVAALGSHALDVSFAGKAAAINWVPILTVALGFSIAVGVFFGTYPAMRASRLEPIDCLRHE